MDRAESGDALGDQATKLFVGVCTVCFTVDVRGFAMLGKVYKVCTVSCLGILGVGQM